MKTHTYETRVTWIGNDGEGTKTYRGYRRDHLIEVDGRPVIPASSDPSFRGDPTRYNPEQLLVSALSSCHMLWYLHLCTNAGIVVTEYEDTASGAMSEHADGSGEFTAVTLRPRAAITDPARIADAMALHARAHELCFVARSVNFPVEHQPVVVAA